MTSTMTRYLTLLAWLASPATACGNVNSTSAVSPDAPIGGAPDTLTGAPPSRNLALEALQFTATQSARAQAVVSTASGDLTLEAWVRWDGGTTLQGVAYNGNSSSSGYGLYPDGGTPHVLVGGKGFVSCTGCALTPGNCLLINSIKVV